MIPTNLRVFMVGARPKNSTEIKIQKYLTEKTRHFSKEKYTKWPELLMMKPTRRVSSTPYYGCNVFCQFGLRIAL